MKKVRCCVPSQVVDRLLFLPVLQFFLGRFDGVFQKHGNGHRTDATRNRSDVACDFLDVREIDIAPEFAVFVAFHTDVDHDGTRFDHIGLDDVALAGGSDQDVCQSRMVAQITGFGRRHGRHGSDN